MACTLGARSGAVPVVVVTLAMIPGCWLVKASIAGLVSCRFPATSRMFRVTGFDGVLASEAAPVLPAPVLLAPVLLAALGLLGAPQAARKGVATAPAARPPSSVRREIGLGAALFSGMAIRTLRVWWGNVAVGEGGRAG